jgi:hypothetical protein
VVVPRGQVDPAVKAAAADALRQGVGGAVSKLGALGWEVRRLDVGWLPALAPTTRGVYEDEDGSRVELMAAAGDLPGMADVASLLDGAEPFPVGGAMGWRAPVGDGGTTVTVWQVAAGRIGAIRDDGLTVDAVRALAESVLPVEPAPGARPVARVAGQSPPGSEPRWVVEWDSRLAGFEEAPCNTVWVEGDIVGPSCGMTPPSEAFLSFGPAARVDGTTVVYGQLAAHVATVTTDAPGAREPVLPTFPLDALDPASIRFVLAVVDGDGGGERSTWTFLDASGVVVGSTELDLGTVGG